MGLKVRIHNHKNKIKKGTHDDNCRHMEKPGAPKYYRFVTSYFNAIRKYGQSTPKQSNIDYDKQIQEIKIPCKKKLYNRTS